MPVLQGCHEGTVRKIYAKCLAQCMECHKRSNVIVTFTAMEVPSYIIQFARRSNMVVNSQGVDMTK